MALGLWILKLVKRNLWAAGISFVPFLVSLIYLCYEKISLTGVLYAIAGADAFLGAVIGFLVSAAILKIRGAVSFEE